jgi:catechol 2,3-dioxygenase-like lactoylglutathione lyase family enzyme
VIDQGLPPARPTRASATLVLGARCEEAAMSTTEIRGNDATAPVTHIDMKLEVIVIPVSDVERSTEFYRRLGWRQDVTPPGSGVVQFTPHGSWCSVQFGVGRTSAAPGSAQSTFLIVSDIQAARDQLVAAGVAVSDIFHLGPNGPASGLDPERGSYRSLASFSDPDGNSWLLQEVTTRLPGRVDATTTSFGSGGDLAGALRRAAAAHGEHEARIGEADANWPDWYAAYMVAEQSGEELPS